MFWDSLPFTIRLKSHSASNNHFLLPSLSDVGPCFVVCIVTAPNQLLVSLLPCHPHISLRGYWISLILLLFTLVLPYNSLSRIKHCCRIFQKGRPLRLIWHRLRLPIGKQNAFRGESEIGGCINQCGEIIGGFVIQNYAHSTVCFFMRKLATLRAYLFT